MQLTRSKTTTALYLISVFAVAACGILIGNWIVNWRNAEAESAIPYDLTPERERVLNEGDPFPGVYLADCGGASLNAHDIIVGTKTAILFMTPECAPCDKAARNWARLYDQIPDGLNVIAISNSGREYTCEYVKSINFPYPVYCDLDHTLAIKYKISRFPAAMALTADGLIAVPNRGLYNDYNPLDIYDQLINLSQSES